MSRRTKLYFLYLKKRHLSLINNLICYLKCENEQIRNSHFCTCSVAVWSQQNPLLLFWCFYKQNEATLEYSVTVLSLRLFS